MYIYKRYLYRKLLPPSLPISWANDKPPPPKPTTNVIYRETVGIASRCAKRRKCNLHLAPLLKRIHPCPDVDVADNTAVV